MPTNPLAGRVALVTGANHGIGAATAVALAELGADVAVSYLRIRSVADPGRPPEYDVQREQGADDVRSAIEATGARCHVVEADLSDPDVPSRIFDEVEAALGPVAILVNNASGWRKDTFVPATPDRFDRATEAVTATSFDAQFLVDARAGALLIASWRPATSSGAATGVASSASPPAGRRASRAKRPTARPRPRSRTTR